MVLFNQLPPEVLGLILQGSALSAVLWQCGNSTLNGRLSSGMADLSLGFIPFKKEFLLPQMVSGLRRLRQLTLYAPKDLLEDKRGWSNVLQMLPRSLEALTIDTTDSDQVFIKFENAKLDAGYYKPVKEPHYASIGSVLPLLATLNLKRSGRGLEKSFFACLPPLITSLTIERGWFYLPFMSNIPRGLQYLNVNTIISSGSLPHSYHDLANMPLGLAPKRIQIYDMDEMLPTMLPFGLLDAELCYLNECSPALIARLPRSITKLGISTVYKLDWNQFMSPSVTKSSIEGEEVQISCNDSIWPPGLESLSIRLSSCAIGEIYALPRSLKHLKLEVKGDAPKLYASELPFDLESFHFVCKENVTFEGLFPDSITLLHCDSSVDEASFSAALPASVTNLMVYVNLVHPRPASRFIFPQTITALTIEGSWQFEWLAELPPTLISLTLRNLSMKDPPSPKVGVDLFSELPRGLVSLDITRASYQESVGYGPYFLKPFPTGLLDHLAHLCLTLHDFSWSYHSLEHLPRAMKTLRVRTLGICENPQSLVLLPPDLEACDLGDDPYSLVDLGELWPPTSWKSLAYTPGRGHIPRLHQRRLEYVPPQPQRTKSKTRSNWLKSLFK